MGARPLKIIDREPQAVARAAVRVLRAPPLIEALLQEKIARGRELLERQSLGSSA